MTDPPFDLTEVEVSGVQLASRPPTGIAAFAIDSPRVGDRSFGAGVEINGWVIGQDAPVRHVRPITIGGRDARYPVDVRRPDVAAAYPAFGHAGVSGFRAWAPIDPAAADWRIAIEALLADGSVATLAELSGAARRSQRCERADGLVPAAAPDFVIIGAQRAGTTSLHAYLSAHPQVQTPVTKELHFLTDRYERGLDWYLGQFPLSLPPGTLTGESTPYALFHPLSPERLGQIAPRAKLIALLRNPVERAYSHYLLERSRGLEPLAFGDALEAEADRLAGEEVRLRRDPTSVSMPHKHFSYVARGDYAPQLERWLASYPRDQLLVLQSEALYTKTPETFARVATFLGIAPEKDVPFVAHNRSSGPPSDPEIRGRLARHFAPLNARLKELIGWAPDWESS